MEGNSREAVISGDRESGFSSRGRKRKRILNDFLKSQHNRRTVLYARSITVSTRAGCGALPNNEAAGPHGHRSELGAPPPRPPSSLSQQRVRAAAAVPHPWQPGPAVSRCPSAAAVDCVLVAAADGARADGLPRQATPGIAAAGLVWLLAGAAEPEPELQGGVARGVARGWRGRRRGRSNAAPQEARVAQVGGDENRGTGGVPRPLSHCHCRRRRRGICRRERSWTWWSREWGRKGRCSWRGRHGGRGIRPSGARVVQPLVVPPGARLRVWARGRVRQPAK